MDELDKDTMVIPAQGVLNKYMIGDTVLSAAIARDLAIDKVGYVVSNFPELLKGHPVVQGVRSIAELPDNCRVVDLTKSIQNMTGTGDDKRVLPGKFTAMCKEAGFQRALDPPQLYLTPEEWNNVQELRHFFPNKPNVGVVLGSTHHMKDWAYTLVCIKQLLKHGYNVFLFSDNLGKASDWTIPKGCYHIIGRGLREMQCYVAMMDVMLGPDTGPMHVAGAMGIPLVVVCYSFFTDLYEIYENVTVLSSDTFSLKKGITGVSLRTVLHAVHRSVGATRSSSAPIVVVEETPLMEEKTHAYIRIRGLGDLLSSLPGIATVRSKNGNTSHKYVYITSKAGKKIVELSDMFDEVIGVEYDHGPGGLPLPPSGIDYDRFNTVTNMINAVDFLPTSDRVPRTELFARSMHLEKCDYDAPGWKLTVPEEWKDKAWDILKKHGVYRNSKVLAFQVDTKGESRGWPKARAVEFCGSIRKNKWEVVLLSDVKYVGYPKTCVNLTGQLSITEYVGMIAISTVGLSPDSALVHIAGATDSIALGLFGAVDPELRIAHYDTVSAIVGKASCQPCNDWQKASCAHKTKRPECMWNIRVKDVVKKVEELARSGGGENAK